MSSSDDRPVPAETPPAVEPSCVAVGQGASGGLGASDFAAFSDMAASLSLRWRLWRRFARGDVASPFGDELSR